MKTGEGEFGGNWKKETGCLKNGIQFHRDFRYSVVISFNHEVVKQAKPG
jgi:hypothetical protein